MLLHKRSSLLHRARRMLDLASWLYFQNLHFEKNVSRPAAEYSRNSINPTRLSPFFPCPERNFISDPLNENFPTKEHGTNEKIQTGRNRNA